MGLNDRLLYGNEFSHSNSIGAHDMSTVRIAALLVIVFSLVGCYLIFVGRKTNDSFEVVFLEFGKGANAKSFEKISVNADSMSPDFSMVDFLECNKEVMRDIIKNQSIKLRLMQNEETLGDFTFSKAIINGEKYMKMVSIMRLINESTKQDIASSSFGAFLDAIEKRKELLVYSKEGSPAWAHEYLVISLQDVSSPVSFAAYVSARH